MQKKNFPVKVDGKEYWISRSVAVVGFFFRHNEKTNQIELLTEKRGKGAADNHGKLCTVCGYLDWYESGNQAVTRECQEETGVSADPDKMTLIAVNTNPSENLQNVSLHYMQVLDMSPKYEPNLEKAHGGEKDEVEWAKWMPVASYNDEQSAFEPMPILKDKEQWAFDHDAGIERCLSLLFGPRYKTDRKTCQRKRNEIGLISI